VAKGDTIITMTSGGGGWGRPDERDPERVRWDVIEGLVSLERAKSEYGVVITEDLFEIDADATRKLRKKNQASNALKCQQTIK
jgi:N-methylhydantoinase B